jgi:hypothetical protein
MVANYDFSETIDSIQLSNYLKRFEFRWVSGSISF